ncbi:MAG: putative SOS response-associated peptidase YedK [Ulvibacter sp.]
MKKNNDNPKLARPSMPLILTEEIAENWLVSDLKGNFAVKPLQELIQPFPDEELESYPVARLLGNQYLGNIEEISKPFTYDDLIF